MHTSVCAAVIMKEVTEMAIIMWKHTGTTGILHVMIMYIVA